VFYAGCGTFAYKKFKKKEKTEYVTVFVTVGVYSINIKTMEFYPLF